MIEAVVLDAMGVIYQAGDDVAELLVPFCRENGGEPDPARVAAAYRAASLGAIDADAFWATVGVNPELEETYLAGHALVPGLEDFLDALDELGAPVWCLSNDVARWSARLRARFDLERRFAGFVVSAEIGARKPDAAAYEALLARTGLAPQSLMFVDDRSANVEAAAALGIKARLFGGYSSLTEVVRAARAP